MSTKRIPTAAQAAHLLALASPESYAIGSTSATVMACRVRGWTMRRPSDGSLFLTENGWAALGRRTQFTLPKREG